jgi:RNA polymerase sigma-70 factor (ECF subfamily)
MPSNSPLRDRFLAHFLECECALRGFVSAVVARPGDRDDLVQEIAIRLWQTYDRYDGRRPFTPWAIGVAARRVKEECRKASRRPLFLEPAEIERLAAAFEQSSEEEANLNAEAALAECLAALPENSAGLIHGRYFARHSIDELASMSGQSAAAVYQSLCRIRRRLADCIRGRLRSETSITSSHA